jgi:cobalt-zinc-cadmium efflux system outer membrane protein
MKRVPIFVCLVFVGGCVVPSKAGFDEVSKSLSGRVPYRVHWNQGTVEDQVVADETRRLLGQELTADTAIQIALFNNPELQASYERLGVAQAEVVQAGLLRNPRISFHWGFRILEEGLDEIVGGVTAPFLDLLLMPLKKKLANAEFRRVKLDVADAILAKVDQVADAFYAVQGTTQVLAMRETVLEAQRLALEMATKQHDAGNISDLDLTNEQATYTQERLDLARASHQLVAERETLARLLGVWGEAVDYKIAAKLPDLPQGDPDLAHLESVAVAHRFDLAAAREEVQTASAALRLTKSTRVVSGLDVGANGHRDPDGPVTIGPAFDLELPIFDQKQAEVARLRAQLRASQHRADALAITIRSEVRNARNRLLSARTAVDYYATTLVPLRERIVRLSQEQYNAMLVGIFQLLQAKQGELDAYRDYIEAVRDYWIARSDLERAIGMRLASIKGDGK